MSARRPIGDGWLVSAGWDTAVFGLPALASLLLLAWGRQTGHLDGTTPVWTWVLTVVAIDVAHVWATAYRVYLDPRELARRPDLYLFTPIAAYVVLVVLYASSAALFWRCLAYLAVFHFIRQQVGWVRLYHRRSGCDDPIDRTLDSAAIYSATLFPILHWHANLPREFAWFLAGDFIPGLPQWTARALHPVHLLIAGIWLVRQLVTAGRNGPRRTGLNLVIATTWLAWYGGIVVLDSDFGFTVTNVLIHGVPYLALTWLTTRRLQTGSHSLLGWLVGRSWWLAVPLFLAPLVVVAFTEEWLWDRLVWHEYPGLFPGPALDPGTLVLALLVPLLALPQTVHYVLDGYIWRTSRDPHLRRALEL